MKRAATLLLVTSVTLAACGGWSNSRLNPGNWFGNSREVAPTSTPATNPLLPAERPNLLRNEAPDSRHVLITQVSDLVIERTNSGAIIRATGVASLQGAYGARLRRESGDVEDELLVDENGTLIYAFEVIYPENPRPVGPEASRRVIVARSLTHKQLEQVRTIRVVGETNARESGRR